MKRQQVQSLPPASVSVSLKDHRDVSVLLSTLRGSFQGKSDSVRLSVRGARSVVVDLLGRIDDPGVHVSANLSVRGDAPPLA